MTEDISLLDSKEWRMNNLYRIVNKQGKSIPFVLNHVQKEVLKNLHNRNLCLKARQLGLSTFSVLYMLDETIFNANTSAGIVSYSLEHAQHIFKRIIGHAIDTLQPFAKSMAQITQRSAREITFKNGSFLRVDTTLRGGSYQKILVSEFGKTCARNPIKAEEVMTGTLQTVPIDGQIIIESTGEGSEGYFAEMVTNAATHSKENLSELQYRLFFFPWYTEPTYQMKAQIDCDDSLHRYLAKIAIDAGVELTQEQKNWYIFQKSILGDKMLQEFPSTVSEAFLSSSDAYYFQMSIQKAYNENRCIQASLYDALESVYVAMDIGVNDLTVITFFQVIHGEIRIIDYYEDNNKGVEFYCRFLHVDKPYLYRTIFLPHDSVHRDNLVVENSYKQDFEKYFSHMGTDILVLPKTDKNLNISNAKIKIDRCVFCLSKVQPLVHQLQKYRKQWSESLGRYLDKPLHDISSNYADSFIYTCQAVSHIEAAADTMSIERLNKLKRESGYFI